MTPSRYSGVKTVPGHLTHFLGELQLSRKDLASLLGVSVRTVHNIEHGRKAVNRDLLDQLAAVLGRVGRQVGRAEFSALTADNFIRTPDSFANVRLQAIALNSCELLFTGENPIASPDVRWQAPGKQEAIPFAGDYRGWEINNLLNRLHQTVDHVGLNEINIFNDQTNSVILVSSITQFRHPLSRQILDFKAYVELKISGDKIRLIESTYDSGLLREFLESGIAPRPRKSFRP